MTPLPVEPNEWACWDAYTRKLFPSAGEQFYEDMDLRMKRTFLFLVWTQTMEPSMYQLCLKELRDAMNALPDDSIKGEAT